MMRISLISTILAEPNPAPDDFLRLIEAKPNRRSVFLRTSRIDEATEIPSEATQIDYPQGKGSIRGRRSSATAVMALVQNSFPKRRFMRKLVQFLPSLSTRAVQGSTTKALRESVV